MVSYGKDSTAPLVWKVRVRRPTIEDSIASDETKDLTLCGHRGSSRERNCQLLKLTILAILPGLLLILGNARSLYGIFEVYNEMVGLKSTVDESLKISNVIHYLQKERGVSTMYVSTRETRGGGHDYIEQLLIAHKETDKAIIDMDISKPKVEIQLVGITEFRETLNTTDDNITMTFDDVIVFYSAINSALLRVIRDDLNAKPQAISFWPDIAAYQMLIVCQEEAGVERAVGSTYFINGNISTPTLLNFNNKHQLSQSFLNDSMEYSDTVRTMVEATLPESKVTRDLHYMRGLIIAGKDVGQVTAPQWFDNMTEYIDQLQDIQRELADIITETVRRENSELQQTLTISAVELLAAVIIVPSVVWLALKIIRRMHKFSKDLKKKTEELEDERKKTEELLYQFLPHTVAKRLMADGNAKPEAFHSATIMFSDVVGFTAISSLSTPMQVIDMLNNLYLTIDRRIEHYDVYKVETIGDGYMVASGIPTRNGNKHVEAIARLALDLMQEIPKMEIAHLRDQRIKLRIGFNTGPCAAGVVGVKMPKYCIFGDTVNTASRMESTSDPLKIQMTASSAYQLKEIGHFKIQERGLVAVKGKGMMRTYWLLGYYPDNELYSITADPVTLTTVFEKNAYPGPSFLSSSD